MEAIADNGRITVWSDLDLKCCLSDQGMVQGGQTTCVEFEFLNKESKNNEGIIRLEFSFPAKDISGRWFPVCGLDRSLKADYDAAVEAMTASSAPVICFFNANSENRYTLALSEVCQKTILKCGIHEEDGTLLCVVELPVMQKAGDSKWNVILWESWENKMYWETLNDVRLWWEDTLGITSAEVPDAARKPMYSFWYSMHQNITAQNVEEESKRASEMGFSSVIVDDGWQTEDNQRGYAFCGDWEPSKEKFPDFPAHVKRVQDMGVKYILWFSVPYIGKKAAAWEKFQDKLLRYNESQQAGIFDLRYPEVREYLKNIYVRAVRDWGLDGLKLDFIDEFYFDQDSPAYNEKMDCRDIQDALNLLLTDVMDTLKGIRPDILIEFRQRYVGPQVRKYGNLLRVGDCPGSAVRNRVGTLDLRLLSGNTAVHSDMLMWHPDEKPEDAALQVLSCLFSTVQISVCLDQITEEIRSMLLFWTDFMRKKENLLVKSQVQPYEPENLYPEVHAEYKDEEILVHYTGKRLADLRKMHKKCYYVHAAKAEEVCFRFEASACVSYKILNCCGVKIQEGMIQGEVWSSLKVPTSGMVIFERK